MRLKSAVLAVAFVTLIPAKPAAPIASSLKNNAMSRAEAKVQHIEKNAELAQPDGVPTEFTDEEINAYFASGKVQLPAGVESVSFREAPGIVTASCRVDFDKVTAGRRSANPLLAFFSGIHDVVVTANARGANGQGAVEVQSVSIDGVEVPRFILELFVEKLLQPKYPNVGLDSHFPLPQRIDTAVVGAQELTVVQK
jgi:hypothetical protein